MREVGKSLALLFVIKVQDEHPATSHHIIYTDCTVAPLRYVGIVQNAIEGKETVIKTHPVKSAWSGTSYIILSKTF